MTSDRPVLSAARQVMLDARYGEPTDTYTWELVVDRCLQVLHDKGYAITRETLCARAGGCRD